MSVGEVAVGVVVFAVSFSAGFGLGILFEMRTVSVAVRETLTQTGVILPAQKRHRS